jgi:GntR family transcriptional regulator
MGPAKYDITALGITPVDPQSPIPLYHQVNSDLKRIIRSGKLLPGEMLPPEIELSKAYGVGRQTIREAISRLVDENLLERYAGRGTFVCAQTDRQKFYLDRSFTQQMAEMDMTAHSKVLRLSHGFIMPTHRLSLKRKLAAVV